MAARLVKVQLLVSNLRSVLGDLDVSMGVGGGPSDLDADWNLDAYLDDRFRCNTQDFARRHAQLVEEILKEALSKIRVGVASAGEHPIWEGLH